MRKNVIVFLTLGIASAAAAGDADFDGSVFVASNVVAGGIVSAPSLRMPYPASLVVSNDPTNSWTQLSVLCPSSDANYFMETGYTASDALALGVVKLCGGSTLDLSQNATSPVLFVANVANAAVFQSNCAWDDLFLANINGYNSTGAVVGVQYTGTSLGLFSVQSGSSLHTDWNEASIIAGRLDGSSAMYTHSDSAPLLCMARLNSGADLHVQTPGAAGVIIHSPNGEASLITSAGSLSVGNSITNTHDYAVALGEGVTTVETNAVHARKFYASGQEVATLTYVPAMGDISMGSYTNGYQGN